MKNRSGEQSLPEKREELYALMRETAAEIRTRHHRPCVRFTLKKGEPGLFDSKAGGTPYLPHDMPWPVDQQGAGMMLLAQVDCAGLGGLADFPKTGLLQFFIALDDLFGIDFDHPTEQTGFRVLYHEKPDASVTPEEVQAKRPPVPDPESGDWDEQMLLCSGPCRIVLQAPAEQGITSADPQFDPLFVQLWNLRRPADPIQKHWNVHKMLPSHLADYSAEDEPGWDAPFHQLGGYPYFTQSDPRPGRFDDLDVLLFQLDSDSESDDSSDLVLWGDCGVANFFINREALKKLDFSRVLYNWDCC